jgi:hypothetical protein
LESKGRAKGDLLAGSTSLCGAQHQKTHHAEQTARSNRSAVEQARQEKKALLS